MVETIVSVLVIYVNELQKPKGINDGIRRKGNKISKVSEEDDQQERSQGYRIQETNEGGHRATDETKFL